MAIGNMHKQFGKDSAVWFGNILMDRHTDVLITIVGNHCRG